MEFINFLVAGGVLALLGLYGSMVIIGAVGFALVVKTALRATIAPWVRKIAVVSAVVIFGSVVAVGLAGIIMKLFG